MRFKVVIGEQVYEVEVPEELLREAAEFHARLDRDMDRGWQMSRQFVERPDPMQRCQIVADKLLTGIMQNNQATAMLMAREQPKAATPAAAPAVPTVAATAAAQTAPAMRYATSSSRTSPDQ